MSKALNRPCLLEVFDISLEILLQVSQRPVKGLHGLLKAFHRPFEIILQVSQRPLEGLQQIY